MKEQSYCQKLISQTPQIDFSDPPESIFSTGWYGVKKFRKTSSRKESVRELAFFLCWKVAVILFSDWNSISEILSFDWSIIQQYISLPSFLSLSSRVTWNKRWLHFMWDYNKSSLTSARHIYHSNSEKAEV